ncbi:MAG: diguanylate cyclase [Burkholderiales bacterium]|nr:diguanylate cyclase [Burkholderiales bacterium]
MSASSTTSANAYATSRPLEYQANHDSLTGLANRNLLTDRIEQGIALAKRHKSILGVMLLDLDHFKLINDASGHLAGDALLKEVANRLRDCVRETDTVARLGAMSSSSSSPICPSPTT